jgi:hypothetical protein
VYDGYFYFLYIVIFREDVLNEYDIHFQNEINIRPAF